MKNLFKYKIPIQFITVIINVALMVITQSSCQKYLDPKPDKSLAVPQTLADCQGLADDYGNMNFSSPYGGEVSSDDYYVNPTDYAAIYIIQNKQDYIWAKDATLTEGEWDAPYTGVYESNLILQTLAGIPVTTSNTSQWNTLKGSALFYRAFAFNQLADEFAMPYNSSTASTIPGIVLKLSTSILQKSTRATLQETYAQIFSDLKIAAQLLPSSTTHLTRPTKAAAYGLLSRVYLATSNYTEAGKYADSCLKLNSTLIDYNTLDTISQAPIAMYNPETIYYAISYGTAILGPPTCRIDSGLYRSYSSNDLRKLLFFTNNFDGTYGWQGGYDGQGYGVFFTGIGTDEQYLVRAESNARAGQLTVAMSDLNTLLKNRYKTGTFTPLTAANSDAALKLILAERRKELLFRGLRWEDLRRLNQDPAYAVTLTRNLNGQYYTLPPNDPRYALLIPQDVITQSRVTQNPRNRVGR